MSDRIATAIDDYQHAVVGACGVSSNPRMTISMSELRSEGLSERLRLDPFRHMRALEAACHIIADEERPGYDKEGKNKEESEGFDEICMSTI